MLFPWSCINIRDVKRSCVNSQEQASDVGTGQAQQGSKAVSPEKLLMNRWLPQATEAWSFCEPSQALWRISHTTVPLGAGSQGPSSDPLSPLAFCRSESLGPKHGTTWMTSIISSTSHWFSGRLALFLRLGIWDTEKIKLLAKNQIVDKQLGWNPNSVFSLPL